MVYFSSMALIIEFEGKTPVEYADEERLPRHELARLLAISDDAITTALYVTGNSQSDLKQYIPTTVNSAGHIVGIKVAGLPTILEGLAKVRIKRDWREPEKDAYPWAKEALIALETTGQCTIVRQVMRRGQVIGINRTIYRRA